MPDFPRTSLPIPPLRHSSVRFHNDGWMNSAWSNYELNPSYMREVGTYELLSADDEADCSLEYNGARVEMLQMLMEFPQVIMMELQRLLEQPSGQLLSFIELDPGDDDLLLSEDALEERLREALARLLEDPADFLARFQLKNPPRGSSGRKTHPTEIGERLAELFQPVIAEYGHLIFQPRFYDACVELFITCEWEAPGVDDQRRQELARQMRVTNERAVKAMNRMVEGNLRLVISIARHFVCSLMPLSDLVQEGNIGLMRAVETFEYQRGHRFATYASYWIRQSITHALNVNGRSIRIPVNIVRQLSRIHRLEREFLQEHGRPPTIEELAGMVELSVPRVRALLKMGQQPISLHSISNEERDWNDILADDNEISKPPQERKRDATKNVLEVLEPREREILMRRFGLLGHSVETLEQVAKHFGLTGERIRQLEVMALRKLRKPESNSLLDGLDTK